MERKKQTGKSVKKQKRFVVQIYKGDFIVKSYEVDKEETAKELYETSATTLGNLKTDFKVRMIDREADKINDKQDKLKAMCDEFFAKLSELIK